MAAVVPSSSPSPFAALLRRSKFASYDPAINQVYTTYGGNAHRGNWGLKRPLALRRRQAFITVKSVDSLEQQTEWNHGESQARFIKRWEELGVDARYSETSPWNKRIGIQNLGQWHVDSEFAPVPERVNRDVESSHAVPNIHAMSTKQFSRYLEKLRKLRPAFLAYINKLAESDPRLHGKSLYELAQNPETKHHKRFLAQHATEQVNARDSRIIEQMPHQTGGLSYSHTSPLETLFTTKAQPGFVLQKNIERGYITRRGNELPQDTYIASFAGLLAHIRRKNAGGRTPLLDLTSQQGIDTDHVSGSITNMRILTQPRLAAGPQVVGRATEGLKATRLDVEVTSEDKSDFSRSNPHPPGSRAYNSLPPPPERHRGRMKPMTYVPTRTQKRPWTGMRKGDEQAVARATLMNVLMGMNPKKAT